MQTESSGIFSYVLERIGGVAFEVDCDVAKEGEDGMSEANVSPCDNRIGLEVIHC